MSTLGPDQLLVSAEEAFGHPCVVLLTKWDGNVLCGVFLTKATNLNGSHSKLMSALREGDVIDADCEINDPILEGGLNNIPNEFCIHSGEVTTTIVMPVNECQRNFAVYSGIESCVGLKGAPSKTLILGQVTFDPDELQDAIESGEWHQPIPAIRGLICETSPDEIWKRAKGMACAFDG